MFVGFYEAGVEMIPQGKRIVSTIQVELWDLVFLLLFFVVFLGGGVGFFLMYHVCGVL